MRMILSSPQELIGCNPLSISVSVIFLDFPWRKETMNVDEKIMDVTIGDTFYTDHD